MAKIGISTGTTPNDGTGDSLLLAATKINSNFNEIYNHFGDGNVLAAIAGTWRTTTVGIHTLKNVGIGTTNPSSKLTVLGDVNISGIVTAGSFRGNATSSNYSTLSGVSTYSSFAGIATYAATAGIATYSSTAGLSTNSVYATYSSTAGLSTNSVYATYSSTAGLSTNSSFSDYASNAGVATFSNFSGTSSYSQTAGIATNLESGTSIVVNNISSLGVTTIRNLEVGINGLGIYYNDLLNNVGIGSIVPQERLTVLGGNIRVGLDTSEGLILTSQNGTRYKLFVQNNGQLSTVQVL